MSGFAMECFADAQTTVTSLAAGVGGVTASAIGDWIVLKVDPGSAGGVGALGLQFIGRSVISAGVFIGLSSLMPNTSQNVFFSILFFAGNTGLMGSALALSNAAVNAVKKLLDGSGGAVYAPRTSPMPGSSSGPAFPKPPCSTGKCISSMMY
jgi:hypothetical protein